MTVPDEAVEAAARAMLDAMYDDKTLKVDDGDRGIIRDVLTAAAPFIAAQAWDEGFEKGCGWDDWAGAPDNHKPDFTNPYRSGQ